MQKWRGLALTFLFAALVPSVAPAQDDLVHRYDHLTCYADPQFDIEGAVKVDYGSPLGLHHNPVTISQFAICAAEQWRKMGSAEARKVFLDQIHWLKTHATSDDQNGAYYAYHFPWAGYGLAADWRSGLAQGQAISALIRYYRYIGDPDVLSLICKLKTFMLLPEDKGGVVATSPEGMPWIEEYPSTPPSYVMNGFISAIFGLYEYCQLFPEDEDARGQLSQMLQSVKLSLPAYDTGDWALLDRYREPYPRANDGYMYGYIDQLETLAQITGDPFFRYMSLRWRSFFDDVHVHREGNTILRDGAYYVKSKYPVIFPDDVMQGNVAAITASPSIKGFGPENLLHPVGAPDYQTYYAPRSNGPGFINIKLKQRENINDLVLGLYNVNLYPIGIKIRSKDDNGNWQVITYHEGADRRHLAYYFPKIETQEFQIEAERFAGQDRLILGEIRAGVAKDPNRVIPDYGSFLSTPMPLRGPTFGVHVDAPKADENNLVVMYRHAADLSAIRDAKWELDFIDALQPNERPVREAIYQFRILYTGPAIPGGWTHPVVVDGDDVLKLTQETSLGIPVK